jgi:TolA-binding protein
MADSAKEALHDAYFDGIPVDDGPNYAKGLKALAEYIDRELRMVENDHQDQETFLQELEQRLDQMQKRVAQLRHIVNNRDYQSLKARVDRDYDGTATAIRDLESRVDEVEQDLTEHEEKIGKREREIGGLDTRIGRIEDRLEGLEDAVYADADNSPVQKALSVAHRAEQKADDTDALLGELLGEGVLRAESVTTGTPSGDTTSEQAAKEGRWDDVELALDHVAALVQKAFDGVELEAVLSVRDRAPGLAFSLEDEPVQYVAFSDLEVKMRELVRADDLTTALRDTYLGELREDEAKAPDGETPDDETPDEEDPTEGVSSTGDLTPGQQTGALKSAISRAFEDGELHDCVGYPDFGHVRFSLRTHRYRVMYLEGGGLFVEEVDDGMFARNERAALVEDALELALS